MGDRNMDVNGKIGVVTGAGSGIGRETALLLSKNGMALALADVDESALKATVDSILDGGGQAIGVVTDVSKLESIKNLAEVTLALLVEAARASLRETPRGSCRVASALGALSVQPRRCDRARVRAAGRASSGARPGPLLARP